MTARELTDHGLIDAIDWSGWTGTTKATSMALELLWTRCDVVVCGRNEAGMKLYDTPERALGSIRAKASGQSAEQFSRWALLERVEAAGLLSRSGSATWSMLSDIRESGMVDELIRSGELIEVMIEGSSRRYLTLPSFPATRSPRFDDRVRILGPLDPLIWDRQLIRTTFDFDYVWEVYKPEHMRRWGWYVSPLLHRDELIGRIEARIADGLLIVKKLWLERVFDPEPVRTAIERHAERSGCSGIRMKKITPAKTSRL